MKGSPRSVAAAVLGTLVLAAWLVPSTSVRAQQALPEAVARALRDAHVSAAHVAAEVQEVGGLYPLLSHNAALAMEPASVMKLVTTYAGLGLLGPTYSWKTEFYVRKPPQDGVLDGDLFLKGSGDPKLTIENFWLLLRALRVAGVREIRGDLVLDRSAFIGEDIDPAKFDQEPLRPYNVGPDPLLVNFKAVRFDFLPDPDHRAVRIVPEPDLSRIEVTNSVKLVPGSCGDWRARLQADVQSSPASARVTFSGVIPAACGERAWYLGLLSHPDYVYGIFKSLWAELGGTLRGGWRDGGVPEDARVIAMHESPPLAEIVRDINKFSNNVMARQLFLSLGAGGDKTPASTVRAAAAVQSWLHDQAIALPQLVLENGSGLSRIERVSAAGLVHLLLAAYASPLMPEFISSLPLAADDGTLQNRRGLEAMAGQAHIKTGSLNAVRSIAGYVQDRAGRRYAVAFLINDRNAASAVEAEDAFLRWVYGRAGERAGRRRGQSP